MRRCCPPAPQWYGCVVRGLVPSIGSLLLLLGCLRGDLPRWPAEELEGGDLTGGDPAPRCTWSSFSTPVLLDGVNSSSQDWDPSLSEDMLELFFSSTRGGGLGENDLYRATRVSVTDPFGEVENLTALNSSAIDSGPNLSADSLTLYFTSTRSGYSTVYRATRAAPAAPFGAPVELHGVVDLLSFEIVEADVSRDELRLYLHATTGAGSTLWLATRYDAAGEILGLQQLRELDGSGEEAFPCISADERTIYWSQCPGGGGPCDIWLAQRPDSLARFGAPRPLDEVNSVSNEDDPDISADGSVLLFSSNRPGSSNDDLWLTRRECR